MISYHDLVTQVIPGPRSLSFYIPLVLLPVALAIPPDVLSHRALCLTFIPVMLASTIHAQYAMEGIEVMSTTLAFWYIFLLAARDSRTSFRRVIRRTPGQNQLPEKDISSEEKRTLGNDILTQHGSPVYDEVPYPSNFVQRLSWIGTLVVSLRLTDWKFGDPSHDRKQPTRPTGKSHLNFITTAISRTAVGYLLLDISSAYILTDPYFHDLTVSINSPLPSAGNIDKSNSTSTPNVLPLIYSVIPPPLFRCLIILVQAYAIMSQQYHLPLVPLVALHYFGRVSDTWAPHLWPPYFGSATSILDKGLAGLWGEYWHQMLRWVVSGYGSILADLLGYKLPDQSSSSSASPPTPSPSPSPPSSSPSPGPTSTQSSTPNNHRKDSTVSPSTANGTPTPTKPSEQPPGQQAAARALKKLKVARFIILALTAFFNSGLLHMGLVPPHPPRATLSPLKIRLILASFFWIQPVGLAIEMLGRKVLGRCLPHAFSQATGGGVRGEVGKGTPLVTLVMFLRRAGNVVWILLWGCVTFPLLGEVARQLSWCEYYAVPWSLVRVVQGKEWIMWPVVQ